MLGLILAALTASASPAASPAPSPSASASPLRTIVTVHTSPFCSQLASHVNAAIGAAVQNDQTLASTILTLRSGDLSNSDLSRQHEIYRLQDMGDSIYRQYKAGEDEVGHLRELAKSAQDEQEKKDLKDAADALGGVLYRQHLIQRDLDGFVAYLYAADMQQETNSVELNREFAGGDMRDAWANTGPTRWNPVIQQQIAQLPVYHQRDDDVHMAASASKDFQQRIPDIMSDEMVAGERITQASGGC